MIAGSQPAVAMERIRAIGVSPSDLARSADINKHRRCTVSQLREEVPAATVTAFWIKRRLQLSQTFLVVSGTMVSFQSASKSIVVMTQGWGMISF